MIDRLNGIEIERGSSGSATQPTHVATALAGIALAVVVAILSDMVVVFKGCIGVQ